ncbi:MAG: hypothetical protein R3D26_06140 [Cyanobacteriota/Melainabacteria group bacterium]
MNLHLSQNQHRISNLHPYLENLIMRMLRAEASDRPQSMGDVKGAGEHCPGRTYILPKRNIRQYPQQGCQQPTARISC